MIPLSLASDPRALVSSGEVKGASEARGPRCDEPADGSADQTCSKCSPGVSDTLGEQVRRPVGVYECGVLQ